MAADGDRVLWGTRWWRHGSLQGEEGNHVGTLPVWGKKMPRECLEGHLPTLGGRGSLERELVVHRCSGWPRVAALWRAPPTAALLSVKRLQPNRPMLWAHRKRGSAMVTFEPWSSAGLDNGLGKKKYPRNSGNYVCNRARGVLEEVPRAGAARYFVALDSVVCKHTRAWRLKLGGARTKRRHPGLGACLPYHTVVAYRLASAWRCADRATSSREKPALTRP